MALTCSIDRVYICVVRPGWCNSWHKRSVVGAVAELSDVKCRAGLQLETH